MAEVPDLVSKLKDIDTLVHNILNVIHEDDNNKIEKQQNFEEDGVEETNKEFGSFLPPFNSFLQTKYNVSFLNENYTNQLEDDDMFQIYLTEFLFSSNGRQWRKSFVFVGNETLSCGEKSPDIYMLKFKYLHER